MNRVKADPMIMPLTSMMPMLFARAGAGPGREDQREVADDGRGRRHQNRRSRVADASMIAASLSRPCSCR